MARFTLTDCDEFDQTYETWEGETLEDARDMLDRLKEAEDLATGWQTYRLRAAIADLEDQIAEAEESAATVQAIADLVFP
jgi:uncharacterized protein YlxW (UPF0749 family)